MHALIHRLATLLAALALALASACAVGAPGASASTSATSATICTKSAIAQAVSRAGKAQGTTAKLNRDGFRCARGWSYAFANLGTGKQAVAVTFVFKAAGQKWLLENRAKVCKAPGKQVPAPLYKAACTTN